MIFCLMNIQVIVFDTHYPTIIPQSEYQNRPNYDTMFGGGIAGRDRAFEYNGAYQYPKTNPNPSLAAMSLER